MFEIPVLISGGGPVGLAASVMLSQHGVRSLLVERHAGTALTPKARSISARTMEVFRQCGIEAAVRAASMAEEGVGLMIWTEALAGAKGLKLGNAYVAESFTQVIYHFIDAEFRSKR